MPYLLITGSLTLCALAIATRTKQDFSFGLVSTIAALIAVGYLTSLCNLLIIGIWAARLAVLCAAGYCLYSLFVTKRLTLRSFSLFAFLAVSAVLWWICRGRLFNDWDEFSHWGLSLKYMFHENALYSLPSSPTTFKSYPPAYTLGQFMLAKMAFLPFREDVLMFTGALLSAAFLLYPLRWFSFRKSPLAAVGAAVLFFFVPCIMFDHAYYGVSVDLLLGVIVAFFLCVLVYEKDAIARFSLLCAAIFVLTLTKSSGFGLALLCCAFAAIYFVFAEHRRLRPVHFALFGIALAAKISWTIYLRVLKVSERWSFSLGIGEDTSYRKTVVQNFFHAFFTENDYGSVVRFPVAAWLLILALSAAGLYAFLRGEARKKMLCTFGFAGVAFLAFSLFTLLSYLYVFKEIEAVELASFYRYLCTPVYIVAYLLVAVCCHSLAAAKRAPMQLFVVPLAVLLFFSSSLVPLYIQKIQQAPILAAQTQHDRYLSQRTAQYITALGEAEPRLYLVTANDAGKMQNMIQYDLYPLRLPEQNSIIACSPKEDEPWVQQYSLAEWKALLAENYDYVYIYTPELQFIRDYSPAFEDQSQVAVDRMFKVVHQADGSITLHRIVVPGEAE